MLVCSQGTAQFGRNAHPYGARVHIVEDAQKFVDLFVSYGHDKLDSSRVYGGGTSEEVRVCCIGKAPGIPDGIRCSLHLFCSSLASST